MPRVPNERLEKIEKSIKALSTDESEEETQEIIPAAELEPENNG